MLNSGQFEDKRNLHSRLTAMQIGAAVCFSMLAIGFWIIQVAQHTKYAELADNNRLRTIPLRAPRGVLFDRNNQVLVQNRYSWTIALDRERARNIDETLARLAEATGVDETALKEIVQRRRREPIFRPIALIEHATLSQVSAVSARSFEMPELVIQEVPTRTYPDSPGSAHLYGYVGEIQENQLDQPQYSGLQPGAVIGQSGLERTYNAKLQGTDGSRFVVVNSVGREMGEVGVQPPLDGQRMQLTIDADVQRALEDGFASKGFNGAGVILDPRSGEILAMTSLPAYDPNDFAVGITAKKWGELQANPLKPLDNRLIRGLYSPGSIFKIVMAMAALSEGVTTPDEKIFCPGHKAFYGREFQCHKEGGHGWVDLRHALEVSCNVYFYTMGSRLNIDTIHAYAQKLGLVGLTGIDLPGENASLVGSTEWSKRVRNQPWYPGETISVAIGQGVVSVTPIALATMISSVANGGTLITPHLVHAVDEGQGWKPIPTPAPRATVPLPPASLQAIRDGLWMVVNGNGTGGGARINGRDVSGKTGTAQIVALTNIKAAQAAGFDARNNGWFVFFAPRDNPQIAGVIFAEHGLHGSSATPIAKHIIETFFAKMEGRPLPVLPVTVVAGAPTFGPIRPVEAGR